MRQNTSDADLEGIPHPILSHNLDPFCAGLVQCCLWGHARQILAKKQPDDVRQDAWAANGWDVNDEFLDEHLDMFVTFGRADTES